MCCNMSSIIEMKSVEFQVFNVVSTKLAVFWDNTLCSLVENDWRLRCYFRLHHQGNFVLVMNEGSKRSFSTILYSAPFQGLQILLIP